MSSHVSRRGYARIGLPPCFFSFSSLSLSLEVIPLPMKRPMWQGTDASSPVHTWAPEAFQQPYLWVSLQEESFLRQSLDNWFFFFFLMTTPWETLFQRTWLSPLGFLTRIEILFIILSHYVLGQFVTQQQMFVQTFMFLLFTESFYWIFFLFFLLLISLF